MSYTTLYRLTYTSILDGLTHRYMDIGFESPESAQGEADLLIRDYEKRWAKYTDKQIVDMHLAGIVMYTSMIGRDYKVVPIKCKPL